MSVHKTINLEAPSASGRKFYTVEINSVEARQPFVTYTVDFRYGAVGGTVKTGTKTSVPVTLERAEEIFELLVKEKKNGSSHYVEVDAKYPEMQEGFSPISSISGRLLKDTESPAPVCRAPRLLNDVDPQFILQLVKEDAWWVQIKHDGDRVQLHSGNDGSLAFFSGRSAKPRACPKSIVNAFASFPQAVVLDGELVGDVLWVFDVLSFGMTDITNQPYEYRYGQLERFIIPALNCANVKLVHAAKTEKEKAALIVAAKEQNAEGVCFIGKNAFYRAGRPNRGGDNLRWKFKASASVIVGCHNEKRSVDMVLHDGSPIGTVTIPPNRDIPPVGAIIEVQYLYCQTSLVQAVYKGIRSDVPRVACNRRQLQFKSGTDPIAASQATPKAASIAAPPPAVPVHAPVQTLGVLSPAQKAWETRRKKAALCQQQ